MKILQVSLLSIFLIANIQAAASTQASDLVEINAQAPVAPSVNQPDLTNLPPFYYVFLTMFFKTFLEKVDDFLGLFSAFFTSVFGK